MYITPELAPVRLDVCTAQPRLGFCIYYEVPDRAFELAARHWRKSCERRETFQPGRDVFLETGVSTETELRGAWSDVEQYARTNRLQVWCGGLFTHASKQDDGGDGLEFRRSPSDDGTLERLEIQRLPRLPWAKSGSYAVLASCNSGLIRDRGWAPAQALAQSQRVPTIGMAGFAYFSKDWSTYREKAESDREIYLWAYARGKNGAFGGGGRMPGKLFR